MVELSPSVRKLIEDARTDEQLSDAERARLLNRVNAAIVPDVPAPGSFSGAWAIGKSKWLWAVGAVATVAAVGMVMGLGVMQTQPTSPLKSESVQVAPVVLGPVPTAS